MDCSEHSPARIKPHLGQISKNSSKPASSEHWGVFHENVAGFHFANDAGHFSPESAAGPADAGSFAGGADVLAGKPSRNHVNTASPRLAVEGSHVVPNGEWLKAAVVLPGHEHASGVGVEFNGAHGSPSKQFAAEYAATSACE
jgi:hypothetical protein